MTENVSVPEPTVENDFTLQNNSKKDPEAVTASKHNATATTYKNKSALTKLKEARMNASTPLEFVKFFFLILFHTIGFLITVAILLGVPIAMIITGVVHKDDCPVQSFVPLWLYVSGSAFAFMIIIFLLRSCIKRMKTTPPPEEQNPSAVYSCFNFLISLFTLAWFVAGNVWVFQVFQPNFEDPTDPSYCHAGPYYFSLALIIVAYVWMFFVCCCSSCVALVGIQAAAKSSKSDPSGKQKPPLQKYQENEPK